MDLPLTQGLLTHALEKENDQLAFSLWNGLYPWMMVGHLKWQNFDDYKKEMFKPKVKLSKLTSEEIMAEFMPVIAAHEKSKPTI